MDKMSKILGVFHIPKWLFYVLIAVLVLRIPSFFEPYFYGDEMIYLTLGEGIRKGLTLYKEIYDNKPPLLYLVAAISGSLFWFRAFLAFFNIASIVVFQRLSEVLFPKNKIFSISSTLIFSVLTTIPLFEGNIANAELFMTFFTLLGIYLLFTLKHNFKILFASGVLFSLSTLFKVPALFDFMAVLVFYFVYTNLSKKEIMEFAKKKLILVLGFLTPILITLLYFFFSGALKDYITAAFLQNIGYLSSFRPSDVEKSFLARNLPLLIRGVILFLGVLFLYVKRNKLTKSFVFLVIWLLFTLFAVTLSERPYPHYFVQSLAPLSFLVAFIFSQKTMEQTLAIIPCTLAFFVPFYFNFYHYPTFSYYLKFAKFAVGTSSKEQYLKSFDKNVPRNYSVATFLAASSQKTDTVLVLGDSSAIYALSRRHPPIKYVADYHIFDFSSIEKETQIVKNNKPKYIVILPQKLSLTGIFTLIRKDYVLVYDIQGAEVWKLSTTKSN